RATCIGWAEPGVSRQVGSFGRVDLTRVAANRVWCEKKLHALDVSRRCDDARIHVAATDTLRAGRHADSIAGAVIADRDPDRVRAVTGIVARKRRIVAAKITGAVMDGIMPVVIMVGGHPVPAAVMRLDGVMGPAKTGVRSRDHNSLAGVAKRPHFRRMRVIDPGLNRFGRVRL